VLGGANCFFWGSTSRSRVLGALFSLHGRERFLEERDFKGASVFMLLNPFRPCSPLANSSCSVTVFPDSMHLFPLPDRRPGDVSLRPQPRFALPDYLLLLVFDFLSTLFRGDLVVFVVCSKRPLPTFGLGPPCSPPLITGPLSWQSCP